VGTEKIQAAGKEVNNSLTGEYNLNGAVGSLWGRKILFLGVPTKSYHWATVVRKKSTCGLRWTKKRTGCLSIIT